MQRLKTSASIGSVSGFSSFFFLNFAFASFSIIQYYLCNYAAALFNGQQPLESLWHEYRKWKVNIFLFAIQRTIYHHRCRACRACTKDERHFHKSQMFGDWGLRWTKLLLPYLSDRTNIQLQRTHNFNIQLCFFESLYKCKSEYTTSRLEWWHRHRIMECLRKKKLWRRMELNYTGVHRKPSKDSNRSRVKHEWMKHLIILFGICRPRAYQTSNNSISSANFPHSKLKTQSHHWFIIIMLCVEFNGKILGNICFVINFEANLFARLDWNVIWIFVKWLFMLINSMELTFLSIKWLDKR